MTTKKENNISFQLLMSTLNNYSNRINTLEAKEKELANALQITIQNTTMLKEIIELQGARIETQRQRINILKSNLLGLR